MLLSSVLFVAQYGHNAPNDDDFDMIPSLVGELPITSPWLWAVLARLLADLGVG